MRISDWSSDVCSSDLRYAAFKAAFKIVNMRFVLDLRRRRASSVSAGSRKFCSDPLAVRSRAGDEATLFIQSCMVLGQSLETSLLHRLGLMVASILRRVVGRSFLLKTSR